VIFWSYCSTLELKITLFCICSFSEALPWSFQLQGNDPERLAGSSRILGTVQCQPAEEIQLSLGFGNYILPVLLWRCKIPHYFNLINVLNVFNVKMKLMNTFCLLGQEFRPVCLQLDPRAEKQVDNSLFM